MILLDLDADTPSRAVRAVRQRLTAYKTGQTAAVYAAEERAALILYWRGFADPTDAQIICAIEDAESERIHNLTRSVSYPVRLVA